LDIQIAGAAARRADMAAPGHDDPRPVLDAGRHPDGHDLRPADNARPAARAAGLGGQVALAPAAVTRAAEDHVAARPSPLPRALTHLTDDRRPPHVSLAVAGRAPGPARHR